MSARTLTIAEAAEATGRTVKALRNRCDRGELQFLVRGGRRRIPLVELERAGLLEVHEDELRPLADDADELRSLAGSAGEIVNRELLHELAQAHETIGELRALEQRAGADREALAGELEERRRRIAELELELERARRPWFRRLLSSS